jgi:excisionase family DNA binding protein
MTPHKRRRGYASSAIRDLHDHQTPYVTTAQLAKYWVMSRRQIYKEIERGALKALRLGPRLVRISTVDAIRFEKLGNIPPRPRKPEGDGNPEGAEIGRDGDEPPSRLKHALLVEEQAADDRVALAGTPGDPDDDVPADLPAKVLALDES